MMNTGTPTMLRSASFELRDHQVEARDAMLAQWATHQSAQFISACGTGKTITAMEAALAVGARRIAVFVPSLALVKQAAEAFIAQAGSRRLDILAVCSDPKAATTTTDADDPEFDLPTLDDTETQFGLVVRTAEDVAVWLAREPEPDTITVVFSTYDSSTHVVAAQHLPGFDIPDFDVAIMDEAHHLVNDKSNETRGELVLAKPDDRKRLRARHRLYATATPKTVTAKAKRQALTAGRTVDSMDADSPVFGPEAHKLTFGEAIERGVLCDYSVHVVAMTAEHIEHVLANSETVDPETGLRVDVAMLIQREAVRQAQEQGARRIITYHRLRESSDQFARFLTASDGIYDAEHVSSLQPAADRAAAVRRLTRLGHGTDGHILTNVRCLGEGVDIEALDAVIIIDPKWSTSEIVQVSGRVMRIDPTGRKTHGMIIIPVIIPKAIGDNEITEAELETLVASDTNVFAPAMSVIKAMATQDDVVRHWLTEARIMAAAGKPVTSGAGRVAKPVSAKRAAAKRTAENIIHIDVLGLNKTQTTQLIDSVRLVAAKTAVRQNIPHDQWTSEEKREGAIVRAIGSTGLLSGDLDASTRFVDDIIEKVAAQ